MQRKIVGFIQDEAGDWVAELDCFHHRHMRHIPPLSERPWVLNETERQSRMGTKIPCLRCDQLEWPEGLVCYKQTPEFTETTVPKGLLKDHSTKAGTWGRIQVKSGQLCYTLTDHPEKPMTLNAGDEGIVVPQMLHYVKPLGAVCFQVDFYTKTQR